MQLLAFATSVGLAQASSALVTNPRWKDDCFKRRPHWQSHSFSLAQKHQNPGAGMNPDDIAPYVEVLKDGYMQVNCVKDAMYEHGDKYGNNKFSYKFQDRMNSSIVHYTDIVPKEDREKMTHAVCFDFCRGIPDMGFFGVVNGRDCYCTSYFMPMASDSTNCDAVCEGDTTLMCGGKGKSSVFSMHMCDDTEQDLHAALDKAMNTTEKLRVLNKIMLTFTGLAEGVADDLQKELGKAGDPGAADLMQKIKKWAGVNVHAAEDGEKICDVLEHLDSESEAAGKKDYTKFEDKKWAEDLVADLTKATAEAEEILEKNEALRDRAQPKAGRPERVVEGKKMFVAKQYYSLMYFVDKEYENVPTTCTGDELGEPLLAFNEFECAASCDDLPGKCVGFAFFYKDGIGSCFLYSGFKTATYYTACDDDGVEEEKKVDLLLHQKSFLHQKHSVKLAKVAHMQHTKHNKTVSKNAIRIGTTVPSDDAIPSGWQSTGPGVCEKDIAGCMDGSKTVKECIPAMDMLGKFTNADCSAACDADSACTGYSVSKDGCFVWKEPVWATQRQETQWGYQCVVKEQADLNAELEDPPKEKATTTPAPPKELPESDIYASCNVKLSRFVDTTLKPDPSGKCKQCLKELTRADRCYAGA